MTAPVDYDLHGIVGIRLLDATSDDAAVVTRQVGPIQAPLARQPDIVIRFVDELPTSSPMRYLGLDDVGFTGDAFLVLRSKHKSRAKVQIPFDEVGKGCEIVCERGLAQVPLLIPILNLTVLGKGALPLHASAFIYDGTGVVVTGWAKGGKTETLLAFMANGAAYVGDEWVYLRGDGKEMYGIPEPIRVWDWHLDSLPQYRRVVKFKDRTRLRVLQVLLGGMNRFTANGLRHRSFATRTMNGMRPLLRKQLCVDLSPHTLFGKKAFPLIGSPDKIVFVASHEVAEITVRPVDPQEIARRMVFSLQEEQMPFLSYYWKFRFAFPKLANELIERSQELQQEALRRVLERKEAYEVCHPYPVSLPSLFDAIRPFCR